MPQDSVTERRKDAIIAYFRRVDAGDAALLDLFTDDVTFFFPKFGTAHGKSAVSAFGERIATDAAVIAHDVDNLSFIVDGDRIAVEGRERGVTADGRAWPDGRASEGRFANVFTFAGDLIREVSVYVDPDFVGDDGARLARYRGEASPSLPCDVARDYLDAVSTFYADPANAETLSALMAFFAEDIDWDIPGDRARVAYIGPRRGRAAVAGFFRDLVTRIEPQHFAVQSVVGDERTAVIVGDLRSLVKASGRLIETPFAFVLTIRDGLITRYRMLEDSYAVAVAQ